MKKSIYWSEILRMSESCNQTVRPAKYQVYTSNFEILFHIIGYIVLQYLVLAMPTIFYLHTNPSLRQPIKTKDLRSIIHLVYKSNFQTKTRRLKNQNPFSRKSRPLHRTKAGRKVRALERLNNGEYNADTVYETVKCDVICIGRRLTLAVVCHLRQVYDPSFSYVFVIITETDTNIY